MRISLNWIKDYVSVDAKKIKDLAEKVTNAGVNIDGIYECSLNNIVVGLVLDVTPHPDSDHLNVCKVDVQDEVLQIVCGAPNVRKGIKVLVAKVGAILPGNFVINACKLRGVDSYGMICALYELGIEDKTDENYAKGIHILDNDAPIGADAIKYLGLDDTILSLDLNPNRSDCTNHIGFAYELAAVTKKNVKLPEIKHKETKEKIADYFSLKVETKNCPMYLAKLVKDVKIGPSPTFIKNRLESCGVRSINNVVDISNYVMLEYGQPLHFFDKFKIGNKILVRMANDKEEVITLDKVKRTLTKDDIVITDGNNVIAVAGVMGSLNSEIDEDTTEVLIESAIFNPYNVRYTSLRLNDRSEASLRFEKNLNYEYTQEAIERACYLLEKYADGKVYEGTIIHDEVNKKKRIAKVTLEKAQKVLGIKISDKDIVSAFNKLKFLFDYKDNEYIVEIPNRRLDVSITEDLIEEIGRIYGFDKITNKMPIGEIKKGGYEPKTLFRKMISKRLRSFGLNEVKTYTLISPSEAQEFNEEESLKVLLPMSNDKSVIRTSILPSLYRTYLYNNARNVENINIYEIANVYHNNYEEELKLSILMQGNYLESTWQDNPTPVNFFILKGIVENLLDYLGFANRYVFIDERQYKELHPGVSCSIYLDNEKIGYIGKVNPKFDKNDIFVGELSLEKLYLKKSSKVKYPIISKYPEIKKDVAFIVNDVITYNEIYNVIKRKGTNLLKDIKVFDLYKGLNIKDDKKSLAFSLTFVDNEKTLTEDEVEKIFKDIINEVCNIFNAEVRDK